MNQNIDELTEQINFERGQLNATGQILDVLLNINLDNIFITKQEIVNKLLERINHIQNNIDLEAENRNAKIFNLNNDKQKN